MEASTFGYPRERLGVNSGPGRAFGYPRQAPFERRVLVSSLNNTNDSGLFR